MRKAFLSAVIIILLSPVFAFSQGAIEMQTGRFLPPGVPSTRGAIDTQTGEYYPPGVPRGSVGGGSGGGIAHDPQSGKIFHIVPPGDTAIDPETGRVYPVSGGIVIGYQKDEKVTQQPKGRPIVTGTRSQQTQPKASGLSNIAPDRQISGWDIPTDRKIPNWNIPPYNQVK